MNSPKPYELTFAEYRMAVQLAKLPKEKLDLIFKKVRILREMAPSKE